MRIGILAAAALFAVSAQAQVLDNFGYKDTAELQKVWMPLGESRPPQASLGGDMVRSARLECHFAGLKDWRVYWEREIKADLSGAEQILIKLKSPDPSAIAQAVVYFQSGPGWYRMPSFAVGGVWETKVLPKNQATSEDKPRGWKHIDRVRIAFLPGAKRDTHVDLAEISGRAGWPLDHIGAMGGHADLASFTKAMTALAAGRPCEADVSDRLKKAAAFRSQAAAETRPARRQALIFKGRGIAAQAYALVQEPGNVSPSTDSGRPAAQVEARGFWAHYGDGPRGADDRRVARWKEAIPAMHAAGFNFIAPNVLWSGVAYYPSKVVPTHEGVAREGDYLQEILDAARPLGMKVHAWKVMFQFAEGWLAPAGVSEPFRKAGRLQMDKDGKEQPWLCPSRRENRDYEKKAISELIEHYDVDGLHLDYIRYGGTEVCFCGACKTAFEKWSRKKVAAWPAEVVPGGARADSYGEFKRDNITQVLREIRALVKKKKPQMELSAAVFAYPALARDSVFQDWPRWVEENLLDWVSTMTYTEDAEGFRSALGLQKLLFAKSKARLYPGIQTSFDAGRILALDSMVDQVKAVRELGLPGFAVFEYRDHHLDEFLPYLSAGLTRSGDYKLAFRPPPGQAQPGPALKSPAGKPLLIDDFEDGNLANALKGSWSAECDAGSTVFPKPLAPVRAGTGKSKFALGLAGKLGPPQAPWPYAVLRASLHPAGSPVDISAYTTLAFKAKGDGKAFDAVLGQAVVQDYGTYRSGFTAGPQWQEIRLPLDKFSQPAWAKPVARRFVDVNSLHFAPAGRGAENFELMIDDVRLER